MGAAVMPRRRRALLLLAGVAMSASGGVFAINLRTPDVAIATVRFDEAAPRPASHPMRIRSQATHAEVEATLRLPRLFPRRYHIFFNGCITALAVNEQNILHTPLCTDALGATVDLGPHLHPGANQLRVTMTNDTPPPLRLYQFIIQPSLSDPVRWVPIALLVLLLCGAGAWAARRATQPSSIARMGSWIFLGGMLLRTLYVLATPYSIRAYDWQGHLQYLGYIATHADLPSAAWGWQTYHPPLYYLLWKPWIILAREFGWGTETILLGIQVGSLLLSLCTLAIALWIGGMLFAHSDNRQGRHLTFSIYGLLLATFPSLLFFVSRITNEALSIPLSFLTLAFLLRFWQHKKNTDLLLASVFLGLGLLTKNTALPLAVLAGSLVLLHPSLTIKRKLQNIAILAATVAVIAGWYYLWRASSGGGLSVIGNTDRLRGGLEIPTSLSSFLVFNPLAVLTSPYPSVLAAESNMWEFMFRTALVGYANFGRELQGFLLILFGSALASLAVILAGIAQRTWWRVPLGLCLLLHLLSLVAARMVYPSTTQDFRYIMVSLIPLAAFAAAAVTAHRRIRFWALPVLCGFILLSAILPLLLVVRS